jgi:hypothetical protein
MLAFDPPVTGFTTWGAEGHGFGFATATVAERVRGRVKRQVLAAIINRQTAYELLADIEEKAAIPHLTYWIEPVESFGRMQRREAVPGSTEAVQRDATMRAGDRR